ncbi:SRPBCC family protein [Pontibacter litorisediminis]|uniref:SRPBCC family protein n=1 Tax=Pontibacter litorisediminis TaxID=1846260 RepID=UPI0023EACB24|nr:SRPBCC family protein [Pontibacter litorisediminis]
MKLLKFSLLALPLGAAAAVFGAAYFLPSEIEVQQSVYLQQPPEVIYPYLNNPTEWGHWSVLNKENDPSMIHLYGGPLQGKGARLQWSGDRVGEGQLILTESTQPGTIAYRQNNADDTTSVLGTFTLMPARGGTQLVWRQHSVLQQSPLAKLRGVLQKYKMQQDMTQGLQGLQQLVGDRKLKS